MIYDRHLQYPPSNYSIRLHRSTYVPLLSYLDIDEKSFRKTVAVGTHIQEPTEGSLQCHRGRLENLLRAENTIHSNKKVISVKLDDGPGGVVVHFEDGEILETSFLVGCDGPHSETRKNLCAESRLQALSYLVVNGKRRLPATGVRSAFAAGIPPPRHVFEDANSGFRLEIKVNNVTESHVDISDTYSRAAIGDYQDCHEPERLNREATKIPKTFFEDLKVIRNLEPPFDQMYPNDARLLHWLMRTVRPDSTEVRELARKGVVMIGDAIHAEPILGGEGANNAILDAIELSKCIDEDGADKSGFVASRIDIWQESLDRCEKRLAKMHVSEKSV